METVKRYQALLTECPRCKQQPHMVYNAAGGYVHLGCYPCRFQLPDLPTEQEAIQLWEMVAVGAAKFYPLTVVPTEEPQ